MYCEYSYIMDNIDIKIPQKKIRHLSFSGGCTWGFNAFGIICHAIKVGFLCMEDIQTIYATSIGVMASVLLILKIDIDIIRNYIIKRPWGNSISITINSIIDSYQKKGICDKKIFEDLFFPLLKSLDLSTDITLQQFYDYTGVELHIFTTEINKFELIDLSYKTHPEWVLINAIYVSCSIPNVFIPLFIEDKCFLDGGILLNDPIYKCIENCINCGYNTDEILSVSMIRGNDDNIMNATCDESINTNIFDFNRILIQKILYVIQNDNEKPPILYEIKTVCNTNNIDDFMLIINSAEIREKLIIEGSEMMDEWIKNGCVTKCC